MTYLITFIVASFFLFIIRLFVIQNKLNKLEIHIRKAFNERTNIIPAIFDVTKNSFSKHDDVFKEILKYRKEEMYNYYYSENYFSNDDTDFAKLIHMEELIHHELNFIFKVANKHQKLNKKGNFIYMRELIINKSYSISELLNNYKLKVKVFNNLINWKDYTVIGMIVPIDKKTVI